MSFSPKAKVVVSGESNYGFLGDGSSFVSRTRVDNVWTRAVWRLCGEIERCSMRPYEVALYINKEEATVRGMFSPGVMKQWGTLDRYSRWRLAWVGSPALSTLKYRGAGVPLFPEDEGKWLDRCRLVARIHSEDDEVEKPFDLPALIASLSVAPMPEAQLIAERDRQLAAFRVHNTEAGV